MGKYIIIPDSFKGSITSTEFCRIVKKEILKVEPNSKVLTFPICDGGEGTADCFLEALDQSYKVSVKSLDPYNNPIQVYYIRKGTTAIIESAMCCGLPLVGNKKNPSLTSTYGVGILVKKAIQDGCDNILLGLGGSSTCDGGTGLLSALGVKFINLKGNSFIPVGKTLKDVSEIDLTSSNQFLKGIKIQAMCDVKNPLYGENGASYIFSKQKGANDEEVIKLDLGLRHFAKISKLTTGIDLQSIVGGGACGGVGAGIKALINADLVSGIDLVLKTINFEENLCNTDLVITGEGQIDYQSLDGKAISGISKLCKKHNIPCLCLVGSIGKGAKKLYSSGVTSIISISTRAESLKIAKQHSKENLKITTQNIFRLKNAIKTH